MLRFRILIVVKTLYSVVLARTYGPGTDSTSRAPIASRCKSDYDKCAGHVTVCDKFKQDGVRGQEDSV